VFCVSRCYLAVEQFSMFPGYFMQRTCWRALHHPLYTMWKCWNRYNAFGHKFFNHNHAHLSLLRADHSFFQYRVRLYDIVE